MKIATTLTSFLIAIFGLISTSEATTPLEVLKNPTGVKVRAVFNAWEKYLTPNMCYPDSVAYKVTAPSDGKWDALILQAAKQTSFDVESIETLDQLTTEAQVWLAASGALNEMGIIDDPKFSDKLIRVFEKVRARSVFQGTTGSSKGLEGRFIAIIDLENSELVLLTDGDAFDPSDCADQ